VVNLNGYVFFLYRNVLSIIYTRSIETSCYSKLQNVYNYSCKKINYTKYHDE